MPPASPATDFSTPMNAATWAAMPEKPIPTPSRRKPGRRRSSRRRRPAPGPAAPGRGPRDDWPISSATPAPRSGRRPAPRPRPATTNGGHGDGQVGQRRCGPPSSRSTCCMNSDAWKISGEERRRTPAPPPRWPWSACAAGTSPAAAAASGCATRRPRTPPAGPTPTARKPSVGPRRPAVVDALVDGVDDRHQPAGDGDRARAMSAEPRPQAPAVGMNRSTSAISTTPIGHVDAGRPTPSRARSVSSAADDHADGGRAAADRPEDPERPVALGALRERVGQDRQGSRRGERGAQALDRPGGDERSQRPRTGRPPATPP